MGPLCVPGDVCVPGTESHCLELTGGCCWGQRGGDESGPPPPPPPPPPTPYPSSYSWLACSHHSRLNHTRVQVETGSGRKEGRKEAVWLSGDFIQWCSEGEAPEGGANSASSRGGSLFTNNQNKRTFGENESTREWCFIPIIIPNGYTQ